MPSSPHFPWVPRGSYAVRLTGYFVPPFTADYSFVPWKDNDEDVKLYLSTDSDSANLELIASHTSGRPMYMQGWRVSSYRRLEAGRAYYFKVTHGMHHTFEQGRAGKMRIKLCVQPPAGSYTLPSDVGGANLWWEDRSGVKMGYPSDESKLFDLTCAPGFASGVNGWNWNKVHPPPVPLNSGLARWRLRALVCALGRRLLIFTLRARVRPSYGADDHPPQLRRLDRQPRDQPRPAFLLPPSQPYPHRRRDWRRQRHGANRPHHAVDDVGRIQRRCCRPHRRCVISPTTPHPPCFAPRHTSATHTLTSSPPPYIVDRCLDRLLRRYKLACLLGIRRICRLWPWLRGVRLSCRHPVRALGLASKAVQSPPRAGWTCRPSLPCRPRPAILALRCC